MNNYMELRTELDVYVLTNRVHKYEIADHLGISEQALYKSLRKLTPDKLEKYKAVVDALVAERQKG